MQRLLITILLPVTLLPLSYCKKGDSGSGSSGPVPTSTGTPVGTMETHTIDATGGSFASFDSSVVVIVPAGAVTASTNFGLQEVSNTCSAGIGKSFALTPHGTIFQKPVSIRFSFAGLEEVNVPEALSIAYQDKDGIWRMVNGANVDKVHKTVTIQTTHLSNWSMLQWFKLKPVSAVLKPGESIQLKVISFIDLAPDDLLTPLLPSNSSEAGLGAGHVVSASYVKKWSVGGVGSIQPNGATCTYTAPASVDGVATVAVVAELASSYQQLLLISNITIINDGVVFRINGGNWRFLSALATYLDDTQFSITNGRADSTFSILWPGGAGAFSWNGQPTQGGSTIVQFSTNSPRILYQSEYTDDQGELRQSGGSLKIDMLGNPGDYVSGSFTANPCAVVDGNGNETGRTSITGYFRLKRLR